MSSIVTDPEIETGSAGAALQSIGEKAGRGDRISIEEGLLLYEKAPLGWLGKVANQIREKRHGNLAFYNRNFHLEPTNLCVFDCKFCSYSRNFRQKDEAWEFSAAQMLDQVKNYPDEAVTEIHIVGGVHPRMDLRFFGQLISEIKKLRPGLHIKAFTAVELDHMFRKAGKSFREGLEFLISCGLDSIPGGGAEIFHSDIRNIICEDKCSAENWLEIHETTHLLGLPSNATMLYGHIESYFHRLDHMNRLRTLQDRTGGFKAFIPLKFRNSNNQMSHLREVTPIEDMKNYAVARIFLDNIPHLKAYWPMLGREYAQLALSFGVDDMDGTIDDTTKIYSMAGAEEQNPSMTEAEIKDLITRAGRKPAERNSEYEIL